MRYKKVLSFLYFFFLHKSSSTDKYEHIKLTSKDTVLIAMGTSLIVDLQNLCILLILSHMFSTTALPKVLLWR